MDPVYVRSFVFQRNIAYMGHDEFNLLPAVGEDDRLLVQSLAEEIFVMLPVPDVPAGVHVHHVLAAVPLHEIPFVGIVHEALDVQAHFPLPLLRHGRGTSSACPGVQPVLGQGHVP